MTTGYLVAGILAALRARDRQGTGQRVDISLMGTGLWIDSWQTQATLLTGEDSRQVSRKEMPNPLFNIYRAKDGRWFIFVMVFPERFWPSFCRALRIEHLEHDPRFATTEKRAENRGELISLVSDVIATRTSDEWVPIFDIHGLVWAFVHTVKGALDDPQAGANQFAVEVDHPELGRIRMVNSPVCFGGAPYLPNTPPPLLGQHTEEILSEIGYGWDDISRFKEVGAIM